MATYKHGEQLNATTTNNADTTTTMTAYTLKAFTLYITSLNNMDKSFLYFGKTSTSYEKFIEHLHTLAPDVTPVKKNTYSEKQQAGKLIYIYIYNLCDKDEAKTDEYIANNPLPLALATAYACRHNTQEQWLDNIALAIKDGYTLAQAREKFQGVKKNTTERPHEQTHDDTDAQKDKSHDNAVANAEKSTPSVLTQVLKDWHNGKISSDDAMKKLYKEYGEGGKA